MSGKRNVSVCRGHELANALYVFVAPIQLSIPTITRFPGKFVLTTDVDPVKKRRETVTVCIDCEK